MGLNIYQGLARLGALGNKRRRTRGGGQGQEEERQRRETHSRAENAETKQSNRSDKAGRGATSGTPPTAVCLSVVAPALPLVIHHTHGEHAVRGSIHPPCSRDFNRLANSCAAWGTSFASCFLASCSFFPLLRSFVSFVLPPPQINTQVHGAEERRRQRRPRRDARKHNMVAEMKRRTRTKWTSRLTRAGSNNFVSFLPFPLCSPFCTPPHTHIIATVVVTRLLALLGSPRPPRPPAWSPASRPHPRPRRQRPQPHRE